jgi:hypothetical protein
LSRERQVHPRYLTAIAVSEAACSDFGEDEIAGDGVSEPWNVFEWYMAEGLVSYSSILDKFVAVCDILMAEGTHYKNESRQDHTAGTPHGEGDRIRNHGVGAAGPAGRGQPAPP